MPENQQYPRANLVYIVDSHSAVLNMGDTDIENIDFENTTEKQRSVRVDRHPRNKTLHAPSRLRVLDLIRGRGFTGDNLSSARATCASSYPRAQV